MNILLFTTFTCKACQAHKKEVCRVSEEYQIPVRSIDIDDPLTFRVALNAMKEYGLRTNPSIVLRDDNNEVLKVIIGIRKSIETLEREINERT